jgi:hypothetical protein
MEKKNVELWRSKRDIEKERRLEEMVTKIIRERFSFRFIVLENQVERMGSKGLESSLIGTLSHCKLCEPSTNWLGNYSPIEKIKESGLWLVQHLTNKPINENDKKIILDAILKTKEWLKQAKL